MEEGHSHEIWGGERGVGALEFVEGLMVVGYGEVLVKGGKVFLGMCLLWWGMVLIFFFGMVSGLGIILLKLYPQLFVCLANKEACISNLLVLQWVEMIECGT